MDIQTREASKRILGAVYKAGEMVLLNKETRKIDEMLAAIRENVECIRNDGQDSAGLVIDGYKRDAYEAMFRLVYQIGLLDKEPSTFGDPGLRESIRVAELFVQRGQRYLERKQRYELAENSQN